MKPSCHPGELISVNPRQIVVRIASADALFRAVLLAGSLLVLCSILPPALIAQTAAWSQAPAPTGILTTINNGPGDQTDPHGRGDLATYTSVVNGASNIHYFDFGSLQDATIDNAGYLDFLSDVSGSRIVFTRAEPGTQAIEFFDTANSSAGILELDAQPGSARREGRISGNTVFWEDFGLGALPGSDALVAWDLTTSTLTKIINDGRLNKDAEASPDGSVVSWVNCELDGTDCVVYAAVNSAGVWTAQQLTTNGAEAHPDTNGTTVVYASTRTINGVTSSHIYYQPIAGDAEQQISVGDGNQYNPTISSHYVAYEGQNLTAATPNTDIYVADLDTSTYYEITSTSQNETLNDISLLANGQLRLVWQVQSGTSSGWDVYAFTFAAPSTPQQDISNLANIIKGFDLPRGLTSSLLAKLNAAQADFQAGNMGLACSDLAALINEASAQSGKGLSSDQANEIINAAQAIRQLLGC